MGYPLLGLYYSRFLRSPQCSQIQSVLIPPETQR